MTLNALTKLVLFVLTCGFSLQSFAQNFTDMVYVKAFQKTQDMFYLDLFEMDEASAQKLGFGTDTGKNLPAVLSESEAILVCDKQGKRLPYLSEWMAAASFLGASKEFSLMSDRIKDRVGKLEVRIKNTGTTDVFSNSIGVDSIGTLGMTGNLNEWVVDDATGQLLLCGGAYFTGDEDSVRLSTICGISANKDPAASAGTDPKATTRCAVDAANVKVTYTSRVKEVQSFRLAQIGYGHTIDANYPKGDVDKILPLLNASAPKRVGINTGSNKSNSNTSGKKKSIEDALDLDDDVEIFNDKE